MTAVAGWTDQFGSESVHSHERQSNAARELYLDAQAMRSPLLLAERFSRGEWKRARHLQFIDWEFRNLLKSRDIDLLIIKCPVRHGKSQYLARWAPAWYLLRNPHKRVMICTATASLASSHSRWVRDKFHELASLMQMKGVDPTHASVKDWGIDIPGGGGALAAGVGTSIVGFGANLLIIDDYLKDAKSAFSPKIRDDQWDWFLSTSSTRLEPGGKLILLCTAWHSDDLIGRILKHRKELDMRVRCVTLQALRDSSYGVHDPLCRQDGEALWPERWPVEVMERRKRQAGMWWHSIYQGTPKGTGLSSWPDAYFSNIWADDDEWPSPEEGVLSASFLDPSKGKNSKVGDYSAIVSVVYARGKLWVDSSIDRRSVQVMVREWMEFNRARRIAFQGVEGNAWQDLLAEDYVEECLRHGYQIDPPECVIHTTNKNLRIEKIGKWLDGRLLRFRRTASNELLLAQMREFPFGQYDDGPDGLEAAIALLCRSVDALSDAHDIEESDATVGTRPL